MVFVGQCYITFSSILGVEYPVVFKLLSLGTVKGPASIQLDSFIL